MLFLNVFLILILRKYVFFQGMKKSKMICVISCKTKR